MCFSQIIELEVYKYNSLQIINKTPQVIIHTHAHLYTHFSVISYILILLFFFQSKLGKRLQNIKVPSCNVFEESSLTSTSN